MTQTEKTVVAYKGFDANWKGRNFQYEIGKTYEIQGGAVKLCSRGFHACTIPADVWNYYDVVDSKIARVVQFDPSSEAEVDSKIVSAKIYIEAELSMLEWIVATVVAIGDAASGGYSKIAASGDSSTLAASGENSVVMAAGIGSRAKAGAGGAIAIAWRDGKHARIAVGHVGEDGIQAGTWYEVRNGALVECKNDAKTS